MNPGRFIDGDGLANDELAGTEDSQRFTPGSTFWRVELPHFSPVDCNWPTGTPADAIAPLFGATEEEGGDQVTCNSFVDPSKRVFHEDIPIPGSAITLHYASDRAGAYRPEVRIQASGASVPDSLESIQVALTVAGRRFEQTLPALPNQIATFAWDGTDFLGRSVDGPVTGEVEVRYMYPEFYYSTPGGVSARAATMALFGAAPPSGSELSMVRARSTVGIAARGDVNIPRPPVNQGLAAGWTLSAVHSLDPTQGVVYRGDGSSLSPATRRTRPIYYALYGGGITAASDGAVFRCRFYSGTIERVDRETGAISTYSTAPDRAWTLDANRTGDLFVVDRDIAFWPSYWTGVVWKITPTGEATIVAGNGTTQITNPATDLVTDGIPATQSSLVPEDVAADDFGNLYILEGSGHSYRVRRVSSDGIISTVTRGGGWSWVSDGAEASTATFRTISEIDVNSRGEIFLLDGHRVYKIDREGIVHHVAGSGNTLQAAADQTGMLATDAALQVTAIAVSKTDELILGDHCSAGQSRPLIYTVDTGGTLRRAAGSVSTATPLSAPVAEGPALSTPIVSPDFIAVSPDGTLCFSGWSEWMYRITIGQGSADRLQVSDPSGVALSFDGGRHQDTRDLLSGVLLASVEYDSEQRLREVSDRFGRSVVIERDVAGSPIAITSPEGIVTSLTVGPDGNLDLVRYPDGTEYAFEYEGGLMTAEIDPNGSRFVHTFDETGRVERVSDPEGSTWDFGTEHTEFDSVVSSVLTAEGNTTRYTHSVNGSATISAVTNAAGSTSTRTVSAGGIEAHDDLPGSVKRTVQSAWDEALQMMLPAATRLTMPSGLVLDRTSGRELRDLNGDGRTDHVTVVTSQNGRSATSTVDYLSGTSSHVSPSGRTLTSVFDTSTLLVRERSAASLAPVSYDYDAIGRLESVVQGQREVSFQYESLRSKPSTVLASDGTAFGFTYDSMGRLRESRRPDGTALAYDYDDDGSLTALVLPSGVTHSFGRTSFGAARSWTATPLVAPYSLEYNKERKLTTITAPSGAVIENLYEYGFHTDTLFPGGHIRFERGR